MKLRYFAEETDKGTTYHLFIEGSGYNCSIKTDEDRDRALRMLSGTVDEASKSAKGVIVSVNNPKESSSNYRPLDPYEEKRILDALKGKSVISYVGKEPEPEE